MALRLIQVPHVLKKYEVYYMKAESISYGIITFGFGQSKVAPQRSRFRRPVQSRGVDLSI